MGGVLGGWLEVNKPDYETSESIFRDFMHILPAMNSALDCGAGCGRVT